MAHFDAHIEDQLRV